MKMSLHLLVAILLSTSLPAFSQDKAELPSENSKPQSQQKPGSDTAAPQPKIFTFEGGSLREFISAFKQQLGMDLHDAATIDPRALNMRVPKMKIPLGADVRRFQPIGGNSWELVLGTYNHLSASTENSLGRWSIVRAVGAGDDPTPNAIIFMPPKNLAEQPGLKIKAFSMDNFQKEDSDRLRSLIISEADTMKVPSVEFSRISFHPGTSLLIVSGSQEFVEVAATLVEAYKEAAANRRIADPE